MATAASTKGNSKTKGGEKWPRLDVNCDIERDGAGTKSFNAAADVAHEGYEEIFFAALGLASIYSSYDDIFLPAFGRINN